MTKLSPPRIGFAPALLTAWVLLAAAPSFAQRVSLTDIDAKIDGIQATLNRSPVRISLCRTIDQPGSYVLGNNLVRLSTPGPVPPGTFCLRVTADHVTIDLAGFRIDCAGGEFGVWDGDLLRTAIAVHNGTVTGCSEGIGLSTTQSALVKHIRAVGNTIFGIITGGASTITGNIAISNGVDGIVTAGGSTVTGNTVRLNGFDGIDAGGASTVTGNTAQLNDREGIDVGIGSTVTGNTARANGFSGIFVVCPSNAIGNTATNNATSGTGLNLFASGVGCNLSNNLAP